MVIASAVMDGIGGVDLALAFSAMSATRDIPFVLLTGFQRSHPELHVLQPRHRFFPAGAAGVSLSRQSPALAASARARRHVCGHHPRSHPHGAVRRARCDQPTDDAVSRALLERRYIHLTRD